MTNMSLLLVHLTLIGAVLVGCSFGATIDCNLHTGSGCVNNGPFKFTYKGLTNTWNSVCRRNYQLEINLNRFVSKGYRCTFYMDVPQTNRFIYSIAERSNAAWRSTSTAFVYGYGLKARIASKQLPSTDINYNDWYLPIGHTSPADNHDSSITYTVQNDYIHVSSSSPARITGNSRALFRPVGRTQYIGLNRRYPDGAGQGSGLCRVYCRTIPARPFIINPRPLRLGENDENPLKSDTSDTSDPEAEDPEPEAEENNTEGNNIITDGEPA